MVWAVFLLCALSQLLSAAAVEGTVTDALSKAPIPNAVIRLYGEGDTVASAKSDAQGQFRFDDLREGRYRAVPTHDDYALPPDHHPSRRSLLLANGGPPTRLNIELLPVAQLSGRVLSPAREPIPNVPVGMRRPWHKHWRQITHANAEGLFRFPRLEPGPWILAAIPHLRVQASANIKIPKPIDSPPTGDDAQPTGWTTTYFPNVTDSAGAARIVLQPGTRLDAYDLTLRTVALRRVSGTVLDEDNKPVPNAVVRVVDVATQGSNQASTAANAEGRFEFTSAHDGDWRLFAQTQKITPARKGFGEIHISRRDLSGVTVRLSSPFSVAGMVERDQPRNAEGNRGVTAVYLLPEESPSDTASMAFHKQDGSFVIKNIYPGRYRVLPAGYIPGYYVASAHYGDQDVTSQPIDIANPPLVLKIVYRAGAASLSGTVDRAPNATVVLVPRDEALRDDGQHIRTASCDGQGRFQIDSLRPGPYYAFAFDRVVDTLQLEALDFIRKLAPTAINVDLKHAEAATLDSLRLQSWPDY
ncbi:MAG: carboxypeptidase regulatory-like domain-containing protein [Bryobacterales bacterium]|nr:carboxypeptidase regulatory-like domain-containing protein [Bryobacterales bacterium]